MDIKEFWKTVLKQEAEKLRSFFKDTAYVNWHCTNEHFSVEEYIRANCEYPGAWEGTIERTEMAGNMIITAVKVFSTDNEVSCHVVSFIELEDDKIIAMNEYWGDDGIAPQWRLEKNLGTVIS
ncbi:nuclear transport factor 2 family protein [Anaerocolumna sp. AGMB13020]|uniref:nuclear transport factor 2 family protein n=1 Tax=Anaerocolumna sp. AGMB13020 TaxID=3081750 RepID=UPI0029543255|nr:nuclear transport factor 2 family protein [Anaerocolumna sp. AGMB13020]WOO37606.1 nuclear transport factor 2 family protein [Anaerocolumna sp. AGMB13020]